MIGEIRDWLRRAPAVGAFAVVADLLLNSGDLALAAGIALLNTIGIWLPILSGLEMITSRLAWLSSGILGEIVLFGTVVYVAMKLVEAISWLRGKTNED